MLNSRKSLIFFIIIMIETLYLTEVYSSNTNKLDAIGSSLSLQGIPTMNNNLEIMDLGKIVVKSRDRASSDYESKSCKLMHIAHVLNYPGCQSKAIASFACSGSCPSHVKNSSSKFWQHERSCSCCQQTGLREATFTLDCPSLSPPYRMVKTHAPVDCLCRSCADLGKADIRAQELVEALADQS